MSLWAKGPSQPTPRRIGGPEPPHDDELYSSQSAANMQAVARRVNRVQETWYHETSSITVDILGPYDPYTLRWDLYLRSIPGYYSPTSCNMTLHQSGPYGPVGVLNRQQPTRPQRHWSQPSITGIRTGGCIRHAVILVRRCCVDTFVIPALRPSPRTSPILADVSHCRIYAPSRSKRLMRDTSTLMRMGSSRTTLSSIRVFTCVIYASCCA